MRRVVYVVSEDLVKASSLLPSNKNRSVLVHTLAQSLSLFTGNNAEEFRILRPPKATAKHLLAYHDQEYVDFVLKERKNREYSSITPPEELGLKDDCPPFSGLHTYVQQVAGASLAGAAVLKDGHTDVAINWDGGRHHAHKSHASGFCYVADCVLAILALKRPPRARIMYLDLDLHFSDGVSQAFANSLSGQVLTMSIHHSGPGFFPVSPLSSLSDTQTSDPYTLSLPLKRGASDDTFRRIWKCVESVKDAFCPDFVVVQCGVDGLAGDPCATWNWSLGSSDGSFGWCISQVLRWNCKALLLGGGGYNSPNAARAWSYLTSIVLERKISLDTDIPDHDSFPLYHPSFTLDVPAGNMRDENTDEYLIEVESAYRRIAAELRKTSERQSGEQRAVN